VPSHGNADSGGRGRPLAALPSGGEHGKRRTDLTDEDLAVMSKEIDVVADERRRRQLLNVGHDPLRER
jgi:hypothetical protein